MKVSIAKAADILGVSITTLRRWDVEGKLKAERTPAGHRRYDLKKLHQLVGYSPVVMDVGQTAVYARVASPDEQEMLTRQIEQLTSYCQGRGWAYAVLADVGDGKNGRLPNLALLVQQLCTKQLKRLVMLDHTRLSPLGLDLILSLCATFHVELILTNQSVGAMTPLDESESELFHEEPSRF